MIKTIFIIALILLVIINILVTLKLVEKDDFSKTQKYIQSFVIWLIPYLGAIFIYAFHRNIEAPKKASKRPFGGGSNERRNYW